MKKHKYKIRVFQCPDCGNKMYAAKSKGCMTVPGHMKYLWCAHCKEVKNMIQIEQKGAGKTLARVKNVRFFLS